MATVGRLLLSALTLLQADKLALSAGKLCLGLGVEASNTNQIAWRLPFTPSDPRALGQPNEATAYKP